MIKTLRITSYFAVVLAVVFFACPAVFGVRGDKQIEQFLNSAGAVEEFKAAKGDKVEDKRNETSPLVKQAEAFALYLNPPPKPSPAPAVSRSEPKPKVVTPKFRLVGTSRHSLHPQLSLALIDEPGKGLRWVRTSSKVGHLIIEQVKDGLVVIRDGESTSELVAERPEKRSLLKANSSPSGRITESLPPEINAEVKMSAEEAALMKEAEAERKKILAELDAMQAESEAVQTDIETGETDSSVPKAEEIAAEGKNSKPTSNLETMRISAKEARRLGRLGRRLKNVQREPNQVEDDRAKSDANGVSHPQADLIEPNLGGLKLDEPGLDGVNTPR
jgi:hypothetical protein